VGSSKQLRNRRLADSRLKSSKKVRT